jgi:excisionase family DNA binding protein
MGEYIEPDNDQPDIVRYMMRLDKNWFSPEEARRLLGLSKSTFWRRVHEGAIVARRDGPRSYRISRQALAAYCRENVTFDPAS